jgi:hypothetical protein
MLVLLAVGTIGLATHEARKENSCWAGIAMIFIVAILFGGAMSWAGCSLQ